MDNTTTKATKKSQANGGRGKGVTTTVFLPESLQVRLAHYMVDIYAGQAHVRNRVILEALEAMLQKEGY